MAILTILRAQPFTRGDGIIQIFIDGKVTGSLHVNKPLRMDVPAGTHVIQARMYGMRGNRQTIHLNEGEAQTILIHGVKQLQAFKWEAILFILACGIPDNALHGRAFLIKWSIYAVVLGYAMYRISILKRDFLRPEIVTPQPEIMQAG
jgi:hypothetical protein